jgi:hypothetical protein
VNQHRAAIKITGFLDRQRPAIRGPDNPFHVCPFQGS